jgi:hypothetical protein
MQGIKNDCVIDRSTLKCRRNASGVFEFTFQFDALADHCQLTVFQMAVEEPVCEGTLELDCVFTPRNQALQPIRMMYPKGEK